MLEPYHDLLEKILSKGNVRGDRTGTGTISLFGPQLEFDLTQGFPLLTTKKVNFRHIVTELTWMIAGRTDAQYLRDFNNPIWEPWLPEGKEDFGPIYGKQFRDFGGVDQLADYVAKIKNKPEDRRHIISLWNVPEIPDMALPPCHSLVIQGYVNMLGDGTPFSLDHKVYIRSWDVPLGGPYNIAQHALLLSLVAKSTGLEPGRLIITVGDAHIYQNQLDAVDTVLSRQHYAPPKLVLRDPRPDAAEPYIFRARPDDIDVEGYKSHPAIKTEVSV